MITVEKQLVRNRASRHRQSRVAKLDRATAMVCPRLSLGSRLSFCIGLASAIALTSCSALLDPNRTQCSTDVDCTKRGAAFAETICADSFCQAKPDPKWGCLGSAVQADGGSGPFHAGIVLLDAVSQKPLASVKGQLCRRLDIACSVPLTEVTSDEGGLLNFEVEGGFDGYVSLTDASIAPTLYFFNPPIVKDTEPKMVSLSSPPVMALFAQQIGAALLPERGAIFLTAEDCQGDAVEGVRYAGSSADSATVTFYVVGLLPSSMLQATDRSGFGGIVNVPPGTVTVTGTLAADARVVGTLGLLVRAGTVTYTPWCRLPNDRLLPTPSALPAQIGRYEIVTLLGTGGMARVRLAMQRGPFGATKLVVIKQLRPELAEDPQFVSLFVNEARIALRLNHPNVVHTYEVVAEPGQYFLVMEFLEGHSLFEILRRLGRDNVPLEEHLWVLSQVLAGLHYAHELRDFDGTPLGIVHRDVSPSNVFVTYTGEVKLLDFGIAKATSAVSSTKEGIVKGKIGYAAPEQLVGNAVDARTDVYAVGVMLWEAMARRRRSSGDTYLAMMQARVHGVESAIDEVWPDAPPSLVRVCERALSPSPESRYRSALELEHELEAYLVSTDSPGGAQHLASFMIRHFQEDSAALRRNIANSVATPPPSAQPEPSLPACGPHDETENAPTMVQSSRQVMPWLGALGALLLAGLLTKSLHTRHLRDPPPAPGASALETSRSPSLAPNASEAAGALEPAESPLAIESPPPMLTFERDAGVALRPSPPGRARKKRDEALAQSTLASELASPARAELVSDPPPQVRRRAEPGTDLRQLGPVRKTRSIDEKDPYTP